MTTPQSQHAGFTLIELLIVIVILSIVMTFAVLSIHFNENKHLESLTNQLVNTLRLAEQEALLEPETLGFSLTPTTFQFYTYLPTQDPDSSPWTPISDNILGLHHIPKNVQLTLSVKGKMIKDPQPKLIISPSGELTPFVIYVGTSGSPARFKIIGSTNGTIKSEQTNEE